MARRTAASKAATTVDVEDVARFSALAAQWWDPTGKFAVLHKINPLRLDYIRDHVAARFGRDAASDRSLQGLRILDIGCGGGLLCEPLARLGASVVGVDPSDKNIGTAKVHAEGSGLKIDYRCATAEDLAAAGETFDVVVNMEVVEHVADLGLFVGACASMVKPGGLMFVSTINRTMKAFALAIVGAEYVLGWVPRGTHQWDKFVTPDELDDALTDHGMAVSHRAGVVYSPLLDEWRTGRDIDVNYMLVAEKD
jgi:2-polyprenyl-6-hydroxyphenyl methylase / 3-demethylubiquinone-9 3-methyltransferase